MAAHAESGIEAFPWTGEVERGAWVAARSDSVWDEALGRSRPALGDVVPSGFEALIRVLHPFRRDHPVTGDWADYWRTERGYESSGEWGELPDTRDELVTWRAAAVAHGVEFTPDALAYRLLGLAHYGEQPNGTEVNADGWRYALPQDGRLVPAVLAELATVLTGHTATPDRGIAAIWEGYAGLVSAQGVGYFTALTEPRLRLPRWLERLRERWSNRAFSFGERRRHFGLLASLHALFLPGLQHPAGSGLLSKQAAVGPRLELPHRAYVCFEAGIRDFADENWPVRAPWIDTGSPFAEDQTPNVIWPEDRAWYLISEIDFDSTLIACSRACADSLLSAPGIEAVEITRDTELWGTFADE